METLYNSFIFHRNAEKKKNILQVHFVIFLFHGTCSHLHLTFALESLHKGSGYIEFFRSQWYTTTLAGFRAPDFSEFVEVISHQFDPIHIIGQVKLFVLRMRHVITRSNRQQ
jgi:hypothetical protein